MSRERANIPERQTGSREPAEASKTYERNRMLRNMFDTNFWPVIRLYRGGRETSARDELVIQRDATPRGLSGWVLMGA